MYSEKEIRELLCEVGRRTYVNGYIAANDGNMSYKVDENTYFTTPTATSKGFMTPDMIIKVDAEGNVLEGKLPPSTEFKMHLRVYQERSDVRSVVHAHPQYATGFAVAGIPLDKYTMPEAVIFIGKVPIVEYGSPSTDEIPNALAKYLPDYDTFLLANHGALTVGNDIMDAYYKMERLEFCAKINFIARQLGGEVELTTPQVDKLLELRDKVFRPLGREGMKK